TFNELVDEITKTLGLSEEEVRTRISQFYTDLNIDGRFITLGDNRWGLRTWYPYEQIDEEVTHTEKPKKKKKARRRMRTTNSSASTILMKMILIMMKTLKKKTKK